MEKPTHQAHFTPDFVPGGAQFNTPYFSTNELVF
jgi:hypothetical protein